ncbi:hypothetical protein BO86DRAFT_457477 [Aspergillus japonicus CBS 114.51]|uniref:Fungal STAND N-terminal Goodbye domain-containing protein n=1 Tax=Aspergillus japonicus CBS 114.51 TaxID=1448312 RepID=A0A8T8WW17_ASPJA|nr:hypothetical protein BO86DRAFT_457477 [Aspergillus japonicus CBS 114.51]RAH80021.1 hypothetical protein BO86DRAFT_457477 [Aspergillus japonicus CBS 114.51]
MTATSEPRDEYNLQGAWERVCRSFAQTIKADLTTAPKYTIEEVLEQIRAWEAEGLERSADLAFVKVLGGIVAQGASMYKRVFSSLAELFRKICDLLDRMQIYMRLQNDAVDVVLRKILNQQLLCFVDICALSEKKLQGHKVLIALKAFAFSGDEGVSAQLAGLATLGERESQRRATQGDFVSAGLLLDEVSNKQRPGEIRDSLARLGHNRQAIITRKIDPLNATHGKEDIAELDEVFT